MKPYRYRPQALLLPVFLFLVCGQAHAQRNDTFSVYFPFNESELPDAAGRSIDSLQYRDKLNSSNRLQIIGYADYVGTDQYNENLSLHRAEAVQEYLLRSGFKKQNITLILAKGEVARPGLDMEDREGYAPDRRVDIVWLRGPKIRSGMEPPPVQLPVVKLPPPPRKKPAPAQKSTIARSSRSTTPAKASPIDSLGSLPVNGVVVLKNLYFPNGRHEMLASSLPELEKLQQLLLQQPSLNIRIEGHVCCIDSRRFADALDEGTGQYKLSVNRAKVVYDYLVNKGIAASRLEYKGFGKTRPIITEERDMADADLNRRVEIRVLGR